MGQAPGGGGQLSTYRELCSLASDLNQPDLVYKFMNLANHNAVWNSRKVSLLYKILVVIVKIKLTNALSHCHLLFRVSLIDVK